MKTICQLRYKNLVQPIGWRHKKKEFLLIYEFVAHGSFNCRLFKNKTLLTWATRYKIARGIATALLYLHEEWEQYVIHKNIKSSNIVLYEKFNAKLGDFGLARLVELTKGAGMTALAKITGYMAPECLQIGKASKELYIYSFCGCPSGDSVRKKSRRLMAVMVPCGAYGTGFGSAMEPEAFGKH